MVAEIRALCQTRNTSVKALEQALGFGNGTIRKWDDQSPALDRVLKVANYFNVPVSVLTGEETKNPAPREGDGRNRLLAIADSLSDEELELFIANAEKLADKIKDLRV